MLINNSYEKSKINQKVIKDQSLTSIQKLNHLIEISIHEI